MSQEEQTKSVAQELLIAVRDDRIARLERQRNFWRWGVAVLTVALVIVLFASG